MINFSPGIQIPYVIFTLIFCNLNNMMYTIINIPMLDNKQVRKERNKNITHTRTCTVTVLISATCQVAIFDIHNYFFHYVFRIPLPLGSTLAGVVFCLVG